MRFEAEGLDERHELLCVETSKRAWSIEEIANKVAELALEKVMQRLASVQPKESEK